MIKIVQFTKYENELFFFIENNSNGLSKADVLTLIKKGMTNLSQADFNTIVEQYS